MSESAAGLRLVCPHCGGEPVYVYRTGPADADGFRVRYRRCECGKTTTSRPEPSAIEITRARSSDGGAEK